MEKILVASMIPVESPCPRCGKVLKSRIELGKHMRFAHGVVGASKSSQMAREHHKKGLGRKISAVTQHSPVTVVEHGYGKRRFLAPVVQTLIKKLKHLNAIMNLKGMEENDILSLIDRIRN